MRISLAFVLAASLSVPLLAQPAGLRVEYGNPVELRNVKSVYVSTPDADLRAEGKRQLAEALPALTFAESEEKGDVTVTFVRKPAPDKPEETVTIVAVARMTANDTMRLYRDASSRKKELADAVREVIPAVVTLLQQANPGKWGAPPGAPPTAVRKPKVHTTAGLHAGMTRWEVQETIGSPTNMVKSSGNEFWVYQTSDGTMRLLFRGDVLTNIMLDKK